MKTTLTKIGNSKGVIIPGKVLRQCGFDGAVEMEVRATASFSAPLRISAPGGGCLQKRRPGRRGPARLRSARWTKKNGNGKAGRHPPDQSGPAVGSEYKKTRPCLVVSPDSMNGSLNTVIVAPMTTVQRNYPTRIKITFQERKATSPSTSSAPSTRRGWSKNSGRLKRKRRIAAGGFGGDVFVMEKCLSGRR